MASKKIEKIAKFQCIGGTAKPGAELASLGINMQKFCVEFNSRTVNRKDDVVPVLITIYLDKSFTFILKTSPVSYLLKKKLELKKGSDKPNINKVGKVEMRIIEEIAKEKMEDLNTTNLNCAIKTIIGTVKSMGIEVENNTQNQNDQNNQNETN